MIKLVCLFALVAVVASMPNGPMAPMRQIVKREAVAPEATQVMVEEDAPAQESAVEAQDDMDKAETFGFGYHKVIHVGAPYYAPYHYYPRYYHGYHGYHGYGHYW
ncbi:uncharacterized protein LOC128304977 [Anopheles moucheti]|uniref:uncharacterized protein LOC128304977 n=1 Tax=Anopheles moucheti TaxID=186751 RepID=UPI0022F0A81B|nr:uncharacterized protein LOC128304977 [Anopheles moucheti]